MHDEPAATPAALPRFAYHPDPVGTGAFERGDRACGCCGRARGWIYTGNVYAVHELESVCPWCIADGSVAARWDASFGDALELHEAGVPPAVIEEANRRLRPGRAELARRDRRLRARRRRHAVPLHVPPLRAGALRLGPRLSSLPPRAP